MSSPTFIIWLVATVVVTIGVAAGVMLFAYRARSGDLRDQVRSAAYVLRYDNALRWAGIAGRERTRLVGELRANIADAAADTSMTDALKQLGKPRALARSIAGDRPRPSWALGLAIGLGTWVVLMLILVVATTAWTSAVDAAGATGATGDVPLLPGVRIAYEHTSSGREVSVNGAWWTVAAPLVLALVIARPWRLLSAASPGAAETG
jgi:hypothetical protein